MSTAPDVIVIGAGVNGLVTAALLAREGHRVLVLEGAGEPGGQGRRLEFAPGFHAVPLGTDAGWTPPAVLAALGIPSPERVIPEFPVSVPAGGGEWLPLPGDVAAAARAIARFSARDASAWPAFAARLAKLAGFLEALYSLPAPDIGTNAPGELLGLLGVGRKLRGLGKRDMVELMRTVPMPVQELLDDIFECAPLKAAVGAGGVRDIRQGPRSGGTGFVLLHHQVGAPAGVIRGRGWWKADPAALHAAVLGRARALGVTIRCGAAVAQILVRDDRVAGVVLEGGEEIAARRVVSTAGPAQTLLELVDPVWLDPEFRHAVSNIKFRGSTSRVLYALDGMPEFAGLPDPARTLQGTLALSPTLEAIDRAADAAKYGAVSERPHVELEMPSLRWAGLAPAGKQVLTAHVQWTPRRLRAGEWDDAARRDLGDRVSGLIDAVAPGFGRLVRHREVLTPADLEARYRLTDGAATHGEMTLDQILFMRPAAGASRHAAPLAGLFLSGAGTHPGGGIPGGSGWLAAREVLRHWRRDAGGAR
jgi:phytoene dehydrogenase-like protein